MKRDVQNIYDRCIVYRQAKSKVLPHGLYTPFLVTKKLWIDISIDFVLGFPWLKRVRDSIFIVVDRFFKITHFISCHEIDDATNMQIYFLGR
jgi:hypothetical protein